MELSAGLACRRLEFAWPGKPAAAKPVLKSVDASFAPGSVSLVTGETGAGKSTLLHLLAGLLHPTAGEIWADGQAISRWRARHRDTWRRQTGIVFQHLAVMPDLTVGENLLLPLIPRQMKWSRMQADIHHCLAAADLADLSHSPAGRLSGGQRQRLAIARALVADPRFILADEPTAFQDDDHTERIRAQFCAAAESGAVVIIASHDRRLRASAAIDQRFELTAARLTEISPGSDGP